MTREHRDLARQKNLIETPIYAAHPPETDGYDEPTLRINELCREDYTAGMESYGEALNLEGPGFNVVFERAEEMPSGAESVLESDISEHLHYGGRRAHVKMLPETITRVKTSAVDEIDEFDVDGSVHMENNDDFTLH